MRSVVGFNAYQMSAFGSLRVGARYLQADIINKYQIDPNYWGTAVTGTGAVARVPTMSGISVLGGGAIGTAKLQTHELYRYQAGKGTRWYMTGFSSDAGNTKSVREWGQFDADDGIFFRHARSTARNQLDLVIRSSSGVGGVVVPQESWNRDNCRDLDPTKGNIYEVSYQWLGVGNVQFWINGTLVHEQPHANLIAGPYMRTAQLPMTVLVTEAGGSAGASGFTLICTSIGVDGGDAPAMWGYTYGRPAAPFALSTTETPLLSLRPANTINSIANRSLILPRHITISAGNFGAGASTATFKVYVNSTLTTSLAWTAVSGGSNAERDIGTTAAGFSAGTQIDAAILSTGTSIFDMDLTAQYSLHGRKMMRRDLATVTLDIITVTCKLDSGTGTGSCDLSWHET